MQQDQFPSSPQPPNVPSVQRPAEPPHDYLHPIIEKKRGLVSTKTVTIILSVLVGVCLLAVALMIILAILPARSTKKTTTAPATSVEKATPLTAKDAIDHVKVYFKGTDTAKTAITRPVMAPKMNFYTVIPDVVPLTSVAGEVAPDKSDAQLASILKSMDYDKFTLKVLSDGTKQTNYLADLTRSDVICQVSITKQTDPKADHFFETKCLDMSQYSEYANTQQPLVAQYTPVTATATQYGFVGKPALQASKTSDYNLVEIKSSTVTDQRMSALNNNSMFYQSPDGLWHYFRDHADGVMVECEQYATPVLKAAYAGQPCRSIAKGGAVISVSTKQN